MVRAVELVNGKVRYEDCTLDKCVPEIVAELVAAADLLEIVPFGSVARSGDGPDSDIDRLSCWSVAKSDSRNA